MTSSSCLFVPSSSFQQQILQRRSNARRASMKKCPPRADNLANGDLGVSLETGTSALAIVFGARVALVGLAQVGIGKNIETWVARAKDYGVDVSDCYHVVDEPGDAWWLVGDWKPRKAGEPRHSDSRMVGIISVRVKTHEAKEECRQKKIDISDITVDRFTTEQMRFNELRRRLKAAADA